MVRRISMNNISLHVYTPSATHEILIKVCKCLMFKGVVWLFQNYSTFYVEGFHLETWFFTITVFYAEGFYFKTWFFRIIVFLCWSFSLKTFNSSIKPFIRFDMKILWLFIQELAHVFLSVFHQVFAISRTDWLIDCCLLVSERWESRSL